MPPPGTTQDAQQRLAPSMEHREESDLRAQMLGVSRNSPQRLGGSAEKNIVDSLLVLQGNGRYGLRYGEDHVKILGVEKLGSTVLQPLSASQRLALWAMAIPTTIITNPLVVTAIASFDMTTKRRSSTQFDRAHDTTLCGA
jgi:hypothetical protein